MSLLLLEEKTFPADGLGSRTNMNHAHSLEKTH